LRRAVAGRSADAAMAPDHECGCPASRYTARMRIAGVASWINALLLGGAFVLAASCARTPDEQRIRETVAAMQQAMEQRDPRAFMSHVSTDFIGNDAAFDRDALHNLLRAEVLRNDEIGVTLGPIDVELQGDRATAKLTATFTGGSGGLLPERGSVYAITSGWKREGGDWRCFSARWKQEM
jgi:ketosteroid isomerase-like protein